MSIASLGYVGFRVADPEAWASFAANVLGLMPAPSPDADLRFRLDAQAWRIALEEGSEDDLAFVGFEVEGPQALAAVAERLTASGVDVQSADPDLLRSREVLGLATCRDPDGLAVEIYYGPSERRETPFQSPVGVTGFVTDGQGLGHVVLTTRDIAAARAFYGDVLGFSLSDIITLRTPGGALDMEFYHCNPRHHTLALVPTSAPKRLHHFMLQAQTLDDVGFALDRAAAADAPLTQMLGKHTNDHMVSFYLRTPSGFQVEFGFGAREVGGEAWRVVRHDRPSIWGHRSPSKR